MEESNIEIFVAELPISVKDPAEFLEKHQDTKEALKEKFMTEVIDNSQEWTRWYMNSLIATQYSETPNTTDAGNNTNFGQIFDELASFLSLFKSVDERMKKASIVAPKLAELVFMDEDIVNDDFNRTETLSTTCIQLASNLVEEAANIAYSQSLSSQRKFQSKSRDNKIVSESLEISQMISLNEGLGSNADQDSYLETPPQLESSSIEDISLNRPKAPPKRRQLVGIKRQKPIERSPKPMTNYVSGISTNHFDNEWLGGTQDKVCHLIVRSNHNFQPRVFSHRISVFNSSQCFLPSIQMNVTPLGTT